MLHQFLSNERESILAICAEKLSNNGHPKGSKEEIALGLSVFFDELTGVLKKDEVQSGDTDNNAAEGAHREGAIRCGQESLRLGYTISQVVHGYGALCQAITERAETHGGEPISAREFNRLNYCLDAAIAEAVTEFNRRQREMVAHEELLRLGFLAHEMRNALGNAATAFELLKRGVVGHGGSTSEVLENALIRMQHIIDRSLSEVRLQGEPTVEPQKLRVVDLLGEVEALATLDASSKSIDLHVEVSPDLVVDVDRHLVVSAIGNLVQNAVKFTHAGGNVWMRARSEGARVIIDIEDQCGGLPHGKLEELFQPFTQKGSIRDGLGLGLSIARRAISLNGGHLSAEDLPPRGCKFTIDLPRVETSTANNDELASHGRAAAERGLKLRAR